MLLSHRGTARPDWRIVLWLALVAGCVVVFRGPVFVFWAAALGAIAVVASASLAGARMVGGEQRAALAWGLLGAGLVSAVLGLLQYYGLAEALVPWTTTPGEGQAYGNLRQRNQFATLLSMALVALLWLYATAPTSRRRRLLLLASAGLLLVAQAASTSRTGLLQLLLTAGVAAFIARRDRRLPPPLVLLSLIPLYFLAGWVLPQLAGGDVEGMVRRLREGAPEGHSRLVLWRNVVALIAQHPWTGWGWGELSFAHYATLYDGPRFVEILDNAHNLPLHLAVELGVPAAALVCGGFGWLVLASTPWRERDPWRLMVWSVLAMIVLHSLLEYPLWYGPFQLVFGLCLGMLWSTPPAGNAKPTARLARTGHALAAAALIAIVGYAAWDYTRVSQIYLSRGDRLPGYRDDTLAKIQPSWLYANEVRFAALSLTPLTRANAAEVHALAERSLHFSPEPSVVVKLIESAMLLGQQDEAFAHAARFKAAYPADYARWLSGNARAGYAVPAGSAK
ncbi:polymerase [Variovorax sp. PAMC 28711]|nr:polymerase [Variovorax sp. PAMC 28711]